MFDEGMETFDSSAAAINAGALATAELAVNLVYVLPDKPQSAYEVTLGAEVRNDGTVESGKFAVRFYLDNQLVNYHIWDSIAPGQKQWSEREVPPLPAGQHTLRVQVDEDNEIRELNKQDNVGWLNFVVEQTPGVIDVKKDEGEDIVVPQIKVGHHGGSADTVINSIVGDYSTATVELWTRYSQGLNRFAQRMEHASAKEAEFNADAVFKGAVKSLFDSAFDVLLEAAEVPGLKQLASAAKEGAKAYFEEKERSEKAWSEHELVEYIERVDKQIEQGRTGTTTAVLAQREQLLEHFNQISADDPQHGDAVNGQIVGGRGGQFILDLKQKLAAFQTGMPAAADFEREIAVAYAQLAGREGGKTALPAGRLVFHMELYRMAGGWAPKGTDSFWTIETDAPGDHSRLAETLTTSLHGKKPWQLELAKTVVIALSSDRDDDPWATGEIRFGAGAGQYPGQYEIAAVKTSNDVAYAKSSLQEAWDKPSVRHLAEDWVEIRA